MVAKKSVPASTAARSKSATKPQRPGTSSPAATKSAAAARKATSREGRATPSKPSSASTAANGSGAGRFWLMKSEPEVYSIDQLAKDGKTAWTGVRNYQARNFMRDGMRVGDLVLFYHSSSEPPGVAGIARVASEAYPDPTQFDAASVYHDPDSDPTDPRWQLVDVAFVERAPRFVPLAALKAAPELEGMPVLQRGQRLSVQPVEERHFRAVLALAGAKTRVG